MRLFKRLVRTILLWLSLSLCFIGVAFASNGFPEEGYEHASFTSSVTVGTYSVSEGMGNNPIWNNTKNFIHNGGGGGFHGGGSPSPSIAWYQQYDPYYYTDSNIFTSGRVNVCHNGYRSAVYGDFISNNAGCLLYFDYNMLNNIRFSFTAVTDYPKGITIDLESLLHFNSFTVQLKDNQGYIIKSVVYDENISNHMIFTFDADIREGYQIVIVPNVNSRWVSATGEDVTYPNNCPAVHTVKLYYSIFLYEPLADKYPTFENIPTVPPTVPDPTDYDTVEEYNVALQQYYTQYNYYYNTTNNYPQSNNDLPQIEESLSEPIEYFKNKGILAFPLNFFTGMTQAMKNGYYNKIHIDIPQINEPFTGKSLINAHVYEINPVMYFGETGFAIIQSLVTAVTFISLAFAFYNMVYKGDGE